MTNINSIHFQLTGKSSDGSNVAGKEAEAVVKNGSKYVKIAGYDKLVTLKSYTNKIITLIGKEQDGSNSGKIANIKNAISKLEADAKSKQTGILGSIAKVWNFFFGTSNVKKLEKAIDEQVVVVEAKKELETENLMAKFDARVAKLNAEGVKLNVGASSGLGASCGSLIRSIRSKTPKDVQTHVVKALGYTTKATSVSTQYLEKGQNAEDIGQKFVGTVTADKKKAFTARIAANKKKYHLAGQFSAVAKARGITHDRIDSQIDKRISVVRNEMGTRHGLIEELGIDSEFLGDTLAAGTQDLETDLKKLEAERKGKKKQTARKFFSIGKKIATRLGHARAEAKVATADYADKRKYHDRAMAASDSVTYDAETERLLQDFLNERSKGKAPINVRLKTTAEAMATARAAKAPKVGAQTAQAKKAWYNFFWG